MNEYISIKEAIELTGKSDSTIRRMIGKLSIQNRSQWVTQKGKKLYLKRDYVLSKLGILINSEEIGLINKSEVDYLRNHVDRLLSHIEQLEQDKNQLTNDLKIALNAYVEQTKIANKAKLKLLKSGKPKKRKTKK